MPFLWVMEGQENQKPLDGAPSCAFQDYGIFYYALANLTALSPL